jgi:hypothetical protein
MSPKNRGDRIQLLNKVVNKHFTPVLAPDDRSVLEHMVYACCLEDAPYEPADEAFHRLQESFFDWNEVRVTTVSELCETLHNLPDPAAAALRIKKNLQAIFETRYSFDLDDMIKMNQGKAVQELERLNGMTKFVLGYVTQNALGGHAIPVSNSVMQILLATEIVTEAEASKGLAPGLERTVPKTKGAAFASCLHQLAVMANSSPGGKQTKAILKEAGAPETKKKTEKPTATKAAKKTSTATPTVKKEASVPAKPASSKKSSTKKNTASKSASKPAAKEGTAKKSPNKKLTKRKPR